MKSKSLTNEFINVFYFISDEGDSSSSSDDEGKDSFCDLEGPCCQTLRVPPSSPVLLQKKPTSGKKVIMKLRNWQGFFSSEINLSRFVLPDN